MENVTIQTGPDQRTITHSLAVAKACAWTAVAVGLTVLAGWLLDLAWLRTASPAVAPMKPNTALAFVLVGTSVVLLAIQRESRGGLHRALQPAVVLLAFAVALLAAGSAAQDLLAVDLGIDWLIADVPVLGDRLTSRMSPPSAIALLLLAVTLALAYARSELARRAVSLVAAGAALIGLFGLLGHIYGAAEMYQAELGRPMVPASAVLTTLLAAGVMALDPSRGLTATLLSRNVGGAMARRLLPTVVILPIFIGWLRLAGQRAGWYGTELGLALLVGVLVVLLCLVVCLAARSLDRADVRRRAAEAQRVQLVQSLDQLSDAVMVLDRSARIVNWSAGAERLFGYTKEEALGAVAPDILLLPSMTQEREDVLRRVGLAEGYAYEARRATKSGAVLDLAISFVPIRDEGGAIVGQLSLSRDVTATRLAERALRNEEARWRLIVESAPHGIVIVDRRGIITVVNRQLEASFGYSRAELIGQPVEQLLPASLVEQHVAHRTGFLSAPEARAMGVGRDLYGRRKDGTEIPVEVGLSPMRTEDGLFVIATVVDISERKRAEAALAAERNLLTTLFDALPDIVFTKDTSGRFVSCNAALLAHHGVTRAEELAGKSVFDVYPAEHARAYHADDVKVLAGDIVLNHEELSPDAHGVLRWFSTTKAPLRDPTGAVHGLVAVSRDITQRKSMEQELRDSENRFRLIAESLPQMVWTTRNDGSFDYLSRQWLDYTGVPADLQLGSDWLAFVHEQDRAMVGEGWRAAIAGDTDFRAEFRIRRRDGAYHWFDTRAVRLRDAHGRTVKWLGSNTDIEDRRRVEEIQRRSQKMEALGTLAGGIAHDFNNILLAIAGNARLGLEELPSDSPAHECLQEIDKAGARAIQLVRRILSFSRQQDSHREVVSLESVADEALKLLRAALPAMIEIRRNFAPELPAVSADTTQIHQILMNLATNAAHAIGDNGGAIEVMLDAVELGSELAQASGGLPAGRYVRLSVTDNGCGMDRAVLERIFDPFFTTKPIGEGTGLGLSSVHGIMRNHEGAVTVYSEVGKGTTFRLYFPTVEDPLPLSSPTRNATELAAGQQVMYVDDEAPLVFLATRLLRRAGYQASGFTRAEEALTAFRERPDDFDVVVTDIAMPGMSGFAFVRHIREVRQDIPVIMTSGYVRPQDIDMARDLGVREVITKPDTVEELSAAIGRVFQKS